MFFIFVGEKRETAKRNLIIVKESLPLREKEYLWAAIKAAISKKEIIPSKTKNEMERKAGRQSQYERGK